VWLNRLWVFLLLVAVKTVVLLEHSSEEFVDGLVSGLVFEH